ncbi:MAG: transcription elongation factor GreA [Rhodospirillales bacterium]
MDKVPMTAQGFAALEAELKNLKGEERPAVIKAIAEAREHGDLSENAEYHAAREKQSFIEGRIAELEGVIASADVIDPASLSGDTIRFGATVVMFDENAEKDITYQIVGSHEADITKGKLPITSPLAKGLLGKTVGDVVEVHAPGGDKSYEVVSVSFA